MKTLLFCCPIAPCWSLFFLPKPKKLLRVKERGGGKYLPLLLRFERNFWRETATTLLTRFYFWGFLLPGQWRRQSRGGGGRKKERGSCSLFPFFFVCVNGHRKFSKQLPFSPFLLVLLGCCVHGERRNFNKSERPKRQLRYIGGTNSLSAGCLKKRAHSRLHYWQFFLSK